MSVEELFDVRVYLIDKDVFAYSKDIKGINYARKRITLSHLFFKGDILFAKCVIMVNTGLVDTKGTKIFTGDTVEYMDEGKPLNGVVNFSDKLGAFIIGNNKSKIIPAVRAHEVISSIDSLKERLQRGIDNAQS